MIETTNPLPMLKMLGVFMGVTVLFVAGFTGLLYLSPDVKPTSSSGGLAVFAASIPAGMFGTYRTKRLPTRREKLIFSAWATALPMLAIVAFYWAFFTYYGVPFTEMTFMTALLGKLPDAGFLKAVPWILVIGVALNLLIAYFAVGYGAKQQLKIQDRQAAKAK